MTSMVLASAYLGGAYFFLRVQREPRWTPMKFGFPSVALFAGLLGVATVLHWDKFNHEHVAFWLWAGLYFTAPVLVVVAWFRNSRYAARPAPEEPVLSPVVRVVVGLVGAGRAGAGPRDVRVAGHRDRRVALAVDTTDLSRARRRLLPGRSGRGCLVRPRGGRRSA